MPLLAGHDGIAVDTLMLDVTLVLEAVDEVFAVVVLGVEADEILLEEWLEVVMSEVKVVVLLEEWLEEVVEEVEVDVLATAFVKDVADFGETTEELTPEDTETEVKPFRFV